LNYLVLPIPHTNCFLQTFSSIWLTLNCKMKSYIYFGKYFTTPFFFDWIWMQLYIFTRCYIQVSEQCTLYNYLITHHLSKIELKNNWSFTHPPFARVFNFHVSSSSSNSDRPRTLVFSSGGMKLSMIRILQRGHKWKLEKL